MATAPTKIRQLADAITEAYKGPGTQDEVLSGIVHGPNDTPGFHWSWNELVAAGATGNYSVASPRNSSGARQHPDLAAAIDYHFNEAGMVAVTNRLIAAAKANHPAMATVYEFCGTTNGSTPHPFTVATGSDDPNNTQGWDSSHVTHVHMSFWRDRLDAIDVAGLAGIIAGTDSGGLSMSDVQKILDAIEEFKQAIARLERIQINGRPEDPKIPGDQAVMGQGEIGRRIKAIEEKLGIPS